MLQIDHQQVHKLGGRIRTVGQDADAYASRMSGPLEAGSAGNDGFAAVATLRQTLQRLAQQTSQAASESQRTGDNMISAAANHVGNDGGQRAAFQSYSDVVGGRH